MNLEEAYTILGISEDSTPKEVREQYINLAKQHHPDKHQNSQESVKKFQDIEYAYRLITDPDSFKNRSRPPKPRPNPRPKQPPPPPPPPVPKPPSFKKNQNLDDFLNELYKEGHKKTGKKKDKWS